MSNIGNARSTGSDSLSESIGGKQYIRESLNAAETANNAVLHAMESIGESAVLMHLHGEIQDATRAFSELCDYTLDELSRLNIEEIIEDLVCLPEQEKVEKDIVNTVTQSAKEVVFPEPVSVRTKKGTVRWVIPNISNVLGINGQLAARLLVLRDVTGLVNARMESDSRERKYRELVENANSCILRIDPDFSIRFANEFALNFFGYTVDELAGKSFLQTMVPPTDLEGTDLLPTLKRMTEFPELHPSFELQNRCKNGRLVWVQWSLRALRNKQGGVRELLCIGADITRRKQAEMEADRLRERSRRLADKLVASEEKERARLAACLHDQVIQLLSLSNIRLGGVLDELRDAGSQTGEQRVLEIRALLADAVSRCRSMMDQLVPSLLYEIGLGAALRNLAEKHNNLDGTEIEVEDRIKDTVLSPELSALLFRSARELLMNALKYAGSCRIHILLEAENGKILLQVADSGCGFDVDDSITAYDENGGYGLFDIRERLDSLGGELEIMSTLGQGTTACVLVTLPESPAT